MVKIRKSRVGGLSLTFSGKSRPRTPEKLVMPILVQCSRQVVIGGTAPVRAHEFVIALTNQAQVYVSNFQIIQIWLAKLSAIGLFKLSH